MPEPVLLAFETSGSAGGVAVASAGGEVLCEEIIEGALRHGKGLMAAAEACMRRIPGGMDTAGAVAVDIGPGSYTGLRVGVMTAKTFAWARRLPVVGVGSLEALALASGAENLQVAAAIHARRNEVHAAVYRTTGGIPEVVEPPAAIWPSELAERLERLPAGSVVAGNGFGDLASDARERLRKHLLVRDNLPCAPPSAIARIGAARLRECPQGEDLFALQPLYPRREGVRMPVLGEAPEGPA
jgi:tRNA threonylcarbamoyladenosine biosynthesis protein TsaB